MLALSAIAVAALPFSGSRGEEMTTTPTVELYYNGAWQDVTESTRDAGSINIQVGKGDEQGGTPPSSVRLTLDDIGTAWNPRDPLSPLWGVAGRNTPLRVTADRPIITDTFTRSESGSWGDADLGGPYALIGYGGGTVLADDWDVVGGRGTFTLNAQPIARASRAQDVAASDVDAAVTVIAPQATGGPLELAELMLRHIPGSSDWVSARLSATTGNALTIRLYDNDNNVEVEQALVTVGLSHAGTGTPLRFRARLVGDQLAAKVWAVGDDEPLEWQATGTTEMTGYSGWITVRGGRGSGNTNTGAVLAYDDLVVYAVATRFVGEVAAWTPGRDLSGTNRWVDVEAAGPRRRLGQGSDPTRSTMRRWHEEPARAAITSHYIPLEGSNPQAALGTASLSGDVSWESDDRFGGSGPLPVVNDVAGTVGLRHSTAARKVVVGFLLSVPDGTPDGTRVVHLDGDGSNLSGVSLVYTGASGGTLERQFYDETGATYSTAHTVATGIDDAPLRVVLVVEYDSPDTVMSYLVYQVGQDGATDLTGSIGTALASRNFGSVTGLTFRGQVTVGHIASSSQPGDGMTGGGGNLLYVSPGDAVSGYQWETAATRLDRVCDENDIPFSLDGFSSESEFLDGQGVAGLLDILDAAADADGGILYDHHEDGVAALRYRTRRSLYSQVPALSVDFDAQEISPPLDPVLDDQNIRNDVTVTRPGSDGGSAQAVVESGPLGVATVGRYDTSVEVAVAADALLPAQAAWRVHLGTVDDVRYPRLTVDLDANPHLAATVDAVVVGDVVAVTNAPGSTPGVSRHIVLGWSETLPNHPGRKVTFNLAPGEPYNVVEVGDADYALVGSDTTTVDGDLDSTTTTLDIVDAHGHTWTDENVPFDVLVGGELMTVTAVGAASSPGPPATEQALTVTRSVNGVVKGHADGTPVEVTPAIYYGL